jgi:hypothetical protein
MVIKLGDPSQEAKERVLKILDGAAPPEISSTVANYRASIANSKSSYRIDKKTADQLHAHASSFRNQCSQAIDDMNKAYNERMMKEKPVKKNDSELSEREVYEIVCGEEYNLSGWTLAPYDPNGLMAVFSCIHLKQGYRLESYQGQNKSGNGSAYVFVLPKNRTLPKRPPRKALDDLLDADMGIVEKKSALRSFIYKALGIFFPGYCPLPTWADRDIESYPEGDGTPLSYFQASMYLRQIYELGAIGHCAYWSNHTLVTAPQEPPVAEWVPQNQDPMEWTWYEPEPEEWCPMIWKDENEKWNVTFYTIDTMGADLVFHNDTFINGYQYETFSTGIAHYPGGYEV